jgi:hypothetical protein
MLDEDQFFSMEAYVTSTGYQTVALSGYLVRRRGENIYYQRLLPEHFNGWSGNQLVGSWRQDIGATGHQTLLSRSGGQPMPTSGVYWTKVEQKQQKQAQPTEQKITVEVSPMLAWAIPLFAGLALIIGYMVAKK